VSENLQRLSQLTRLYYRCGWQPNAEWQRLGHLSVLVNLQDLTLPCLPDEGLPGGLPSELTKLTALEVHYDTGRNAVQQLQHLGSLTALQKLVLDFCDFDDAYGAPENRQAGDLAGIQQLSQLTSLQLSSFSLDLSNDSTLQRWAHLSALERLDLDVSFVKPEALAALTQLRLLSVHALCRRTFREVLPVCQMQLLTELHLNICESILDDAELALPAGAWGDELVPLNLSTNICSVHLDCFSSEPRREHPAEP
jgi:hypothetical protein